MSPNISHKLQVRKKKKKKQLSPHHVYSNQAALFVRRAFSSIFFHQEQKNRSLSCPHSWLASFAPFVEPVAQPTTLVFSL